jgi:hypothetical protein
VRWRAAGEATEAARVWVSPRVARARATWGAGEDFSHNSLSTGNFGAATSPYFYIWIPVLSRCHRVLQLLSGLLTTESKFLIIDVGVSFLPEPLHILQKLTYFCLTWGFVTAVY